MLPQTSTAAPSSHRPPSTKDIPPVTLTNIPHVEPAAFKPYLTQVGRLFEAFQRAKDESGNRPPLPPRKDSERPDKADERLQLLGAGFPHESSSAPPTPRRGSLAALPLLESPDVKRRSNLRTARRSVYVPTPLTTIPHIFFEDNFHLENPRTFDVVSERSEVVRQEDIKSANGSVNSPAPSGRKALATNAILQEKLSWYMDTVEVHLISSISSASTSFFAALGSLKELQSEAAESVARIKELREDLRNLDQEMAVGGLKVIGMKRRRQNLRKLGEATTQVQGVVDGTTHCEELVDSGELETALERMDILDSFVAGSLDQARFQNAPWLSEDTPRTLLDLRTLKALDGFSDGMKQLRFRVGKGFESRFLEALLADLRRHVQSVSHQDTLKRWASASQRSRGDHSQSPSVFPAYLKTDDNLRSDLSAILKGLSKSSHTRPAAAAFREAIMREMKNLIRQHLPSSSDDDSESVSSVSTKASRAQSQQDKSAILARNLRALSMEDAEQLLVQMYSNVGEALRRLSTQVKVLLDVTSGIGPPSTTSGLRSPLKSPDATSIDGYMQQKTTTRPRSSSQVQQELMEALDMSSLLGQAVDVAQSQITKILKVRTEQTVRLPLLHFLRYFTLNRLFADECEAVSGRSGTALKSVVNGQITDFVSILGDTEKQRLAQSMESDRWEARDFTDAENVLLSRILDSTTKDPSPWLRKAAVWEDPEGDKLNGETTATETNGAAKEKARSAVIDEEKYILVDSAVAALKGIEQFENLIAVIPSMASDVSTALLDYLKLFNSRTYQLILAAGATRSAGLKNINTKHLALASQALGFIVAIIPYIREFVRRHSPTSAAVLAEFDKVKRLYQEHQSNIHEKLSDIMKGRAAAHISTMRKVDFDSGADVQVSPHMETLVKETSTLHRVMSKHLPETSVRMIMTSVFASYREQWSKAFQEVEVRMAAGKARLLRDAEFFDARLGKVEGAGNIGAHLIDVVKNKKIAEASGPPAATASNQSEMKGRTSTDSSASRA
ncbi:hypothetical protein H2201_006885 [Coniosporium apollinis]|uniref:Vacuolar protein sorting-associated protein 54 n=1 Tax=Coniosporium apollinis TaxID=61459 RepID=A0ABQ9NSF6_9PEZI|nr:hypothetical protein H2201_006885 [Coniosporium apollinis]